MANPKLYGSNFAPYMVGRKVANRDWWMHMARAARRAGQCTLARERVARAREFNRELVGYLKEIRV